MTDSTGSTPEAPIDRRVAEAREIFHAALRGVRPNYLFDRIPLRAVSEKPLSEYRDVYVVGGGKASLVMAGAVESVADGEVTDSLLTVPHGYPETLPDWARAPGEIEVVEAAHPIPDRSGVEATARMLELCNRAGEEDLVLVLLSGGGSALLPQFAGEIELEDACVLQERLLESGATIHETNAVRKHCSVIKGGQMVRRAHPAHVRTLVLSDVVGNDLSVIASGPTVPDPSTFGDAVDVLRRYGLWESVPGPVRRHLDWGREGVVEETCKEGDPVFDRASTAILGSNRDALKSARKKALELGFRTEVLADDLTGEAREVGRRLVRHGLEEPVDGPVCLLWSGETTVTVRGDGVGGRNQELALAAALEMEGIDVPMVLLSAGTDGVDGPTDAAGAWATPRTARRGRRAGCDPEAHLRDNDSHTFFEAVDGLIQTGPTHTNVMDLQALILDVP